MSRYVVTVSRLAFNTDGSASCDLAVIGPFRTKVRAERRAATIRRKADQFEDPEGVTGKGNALDVVVEPLGPGTASADDTLGVLYGSYGW